MLKVDNNLFFANAVTGKDRAEQPVSGQAASFAQYLQSAVEEQSSVQAGDVSGLDCPPCDDRGDTRDAILGLAGELLENIESFASALGDVNRSLKDVEPMVGQMQTLAERLNALNDDGALTADSELKGLLSDVISQAQAEVMKFRRGDYA
ncbi:hypothetical protein Deba_1850 [Desulfarculus baarsii DSM 2075]|uniref:Uncharacterized protein n=1 Tax=Desulfarculus baarsii (strain ATCC 33931 / DSM 2075 / LMG 7858 / VKM B-1802 / 2st14) TaxID=644282 RepID=E1QI22_DESB2|nr:hypothetical protein [Desulfarculus baarsii]ADK85215.1 hypothetical protein Deba_1850 [Desulfarculus baarsii DSM 2075]